MLPRSLVSHFLRSVSALSVTIPLLALGDWLGTAITLPLARSSGALMAVHALDTLRYFALAGVLVLPLVAALGLVLERLPRLTPAAVAQWLSAIAPAVGVALALVALPDRTQLEFPGLLQVYDWCALGFSTAVALVLFRLLEPVRAHWLDERQSLVAVLLAVVLGSALLLLAHLVAAPVYEHRVAALFGVAALTGVALLLSAWAPPKRPVPLIAPLGALLALLAIWPFVVHSGARFVLHGHTPMAGAFATYFRDATDFDGDGSTSALHGGSDCAPFDPLVAPLRLEIPGDGVDQDCRGGDAQPEPALVVPPLATECLLPRRPHIVLLTVDALRSDRVRVDRMTFLTALARRSVWYERAYPPAASTAGTLLGIFTGQPLSDMNPETLAGNEITLGPSFVEELKRAGYSTALYNPYELHPALWRDIDTVAIPLDPRSRLTKQSRLARLQLNTTLARLASEAALGHQTFIAAHIPDLHAPHLLPEPGSFEHPYDDLARSLDETLAEFMSALRQSPAGNDTVVILTADHGEQLGERGREGHGTLFFEEGLRVPLIISAKGCQAVRHPEPVSLLGLGALVRRFARIDEPPKTRGPSAPVVVEEASLSTLGLKRAVIGARYKIIEDVQNGGRVAFDLLDDPAETRDLWPSPPSGVTALSAEYQRWLDARRPVPSH